MKLSIDNNKLSSSRIKEIFEILNKLNLYKQDEQDIYMTRLYAVAVENLRKVMIKEIENEEISKSNLKNYS